MSPDLALPEDFDLWSVEQKQVFIKTLKYNWDFWARDEQRMPSLDEPWQIWMILAGRGFGKTRTGAESIKDLMLRHPGCRIGIIGMTAGAVRDVCFEGEALDVNTPILTSVGWSSMGDLQIGDRVYAENGELTTVKWVSDVHSTRPCFEITFSDGEVLRADANHKWVLTTYQSDKQRVKTTQEIFDSGIRVGKVFKWKVGKPTVLKTEGVSPSIDPYSLGHWLGDGTSKNGTVTTEDAFCLQQYVNAGYTVRSYAWGYRGAASTYGVYKLQSDLKVTGVLRNKHIPDEVFQWSIENRLALVRGLMDSDGDVTERGQAAFNNTNYRLISGLRDVLVSLGVRVGKPNLHSKSHEFTATNGSSYMSSDIWRISFTTNIPVFGLPRKAERLKERTQASHKLNRAIVSVVPVNSTPVKCISVDDKSQIFLAGRSLIPTHNSGLLSVIPPEMFDRSNGGKYNRSLGQLTLSNGSMAFSFSGADPEKLRGFQSHFLWMDELCAFQYSQETWDMSMFGLRLGQHPRVIITTTPKPSELIKELVRRGREDPNIVVLTTGSTFDNAANLPESVLIELRNRYEGTTMGRQELYAELILDDPGALWHRSLIEETRISVHDFKISNMARIVVAIDPSMSSVTERESETGMIVAGLGENGHAYIIEDCSALRPSPDQWSKLAIAKYHEYAANRIVAEVNQGYDLVTNLLHTQDDTVPVKKVYATRGGKFLRAEPIAALYEQKRVHHVGLHGKLEDQMTGWIPGKASPDRLDAMVWAITDLMLGGGIAEFFSPISLPNLPDFVRKSHG